MLVLRILESNNIISVIAGGDKLRTILRLRNKLHGAGSKRFDAMGQGRHLRMQKHRYDDRQENNRTKEAHSQERIVFVLQRLYGVEVAVLGSRYLLRGC